MLARSHVDAATLRRALERIDAVCPRARSTWPHMRSDSGIFNFVKRVGRKHAQADWPSCSPQNKNRRRTDPTPKLTGPPSPFTAPEADWPSCSPQNKNRRRTDPTPKLTGPPSLFTAPEADWPSCSPQNKNRRRTDPTPKLTGPPSPFTAPEADWPSCSPQNDEQTQLQS